MVDTPRILITDGGEHPASTWAELSTSEIIQVNKESQTPEATVGRKLELQIMIAVETFYDHVIAAEHAQLDADGDGRLESPLDGAEHDAQEVIDQIQKITTGTVFAQHFLKEEVVQNIRNVLAHHAALAMDVARSTFADGSNTKEAAAWKEARNELGIGEAHLGIEAAAQAEAALKKASAPTTKGKE